jgi:glucoamylase
VLKGLVDRFLAGDSHFEGIIRSYISAQANLQVVQTRSGGLSTGGPGEPKFHVDKTAFDGDWGRPQNDGPPLRATAMIGYAKYLMVWPSSASGYVLAVLATYY